MLRDSNNGTLACSNCLAGCMIADLVFANKNDIV